MDPIDQDRLGLRIVNMIIDYTDILSSWLRVGLTCAGEALSKIIEHIYYTKLVTDGSHSRM